MRRRYLGLLVAASFTTLAPGPSWAQQVDAQKIKNLKSQQTSIENRIAELQSQVDDTYAGRFYCSAEDRTEDYNKIRALQREIAALRREYADFKAGFVKLAATPTAGPQFDAAGIHPDERSYWTADDNALSKLRESALAKANRIEQAPIRDCSEKTAAPTPPPASQPPSKASVGEQSGSGKAPVPPQAPAKGPTTALGGLPGTGCTEKERTERRLKLQDEILRLERELIPIDGTTPQGRARQLELIREIDRLSAMMGSDCPPLLATSQPAMPPPAQPTLGGPLSPFAKEVLDVHNKARAEYGAPPLKWDDSLVGGVAGAAAFAEQLARAGKMVHAPREGRGKVRENISQGMPWWSTRQLLESWTKEKAKFKPGKFPDVSTTHNWYDVGHWAQMIWIKTVTIGCAKAAGIGAVWLVCRYDPGGNKDGEWVGVPAQQGADAPAFKVASGIPGAVPQPEPGQYMNTGFKVASGLDYATQPSTPTADGNPGSFATVADAQSPAKGGEPTLKGYYDPAGGEKWPDLVLDTRPSWFNYDLGVCPDPAAGVAEAGEDTALQLGLKWVFGDGMSIAAMDQETKVEAPKLGGMPELFDPKAQPDVIILQTEPYFITVTPTKISDCIM